MKKKAMRKLRLGGLCVALFGVWTLLIQWIEVKPLGVNGTDIGFAGLNVWFHELTGVHMVLYRVTDWLGLVPLLVCLLFGGLGVYQWLGRKRLCRVDSDVILLGIYYLLVIVCYLTFEQVPINYRPVLIEGRMEVSYPSSTTLLVLCVMPTLVFQVERRVKNKRLRRGISHLTMTFSVCMVLGRAISGVHWLTDIVGSVLLSVGLFWLYQGAVWYILPES